MSDPRILIYGTSYVGKGAQGYAGRVVDLWAQLALKLNPDIHVLIVDSLSPEKPACFEDPEIDVYSFPENIGHLNVNGVDGWGRAFCKGFKIGIQENYDWIAHIDCDLIFTRPVRPIIENCMRAGVKVACPWDIMYNFAETALLFVDVQYLKDIDFLGRYDWTRPREKRIVPPEVELEQIFGDDLFLLPLRGVRNDSDRLTVNNLKQAFRHGVDYLTHCKDFEVYRRLVEMKGIEL